MSTGRLMGAAAIAGVAGALLGWIAHTAPPAPAPRCPEAPDCPEVSDCPACPACPESGPAPAPATQPNRTGAPVPAVPAIPDPALLGLKGANGPTTADLAPLVKHHPEWSDAWPADLAPDGFARNARAAVEGCGGGFSWVDADCDEPPCYAMITTAGAANDGTIGAWLGECSAWSDRYGDTVDRWTRCSRPLQCPSGQVWLIGLTSQRALDLLAAEGFDTMDLKALQQQRCDDATALVTCP